MEPVQRRLAIGAQLRKLPHIANQVFGYNHLIAPAYPMIDGGQRWPTEVIFEKKA